MCRQFHKSRTIPICDPKRAVDSHRSEIVSGILRVVKSGCYIGGEQVASFEGEFSEYLGVAYTVGTASGTDALQLALRTCGIKAGDKVATVSHTSVATVAAIELVGAVPVFVDIDPNRFTMDPDHLQHVLRIDASRSANSHIRAVIPVHLYGQPADMPSIQSIASTYDIIVIEDCAQAHGASINGKKCGTWGHIGAFSFYPTKNLGCLGDGGAIITNDSVLANRSRQMREYGWQERFISEFPGMNTRLDPLQAAVLRVKLKFLDEDNKGRQQIARTYRDELANTQLTLPVEFASVQHVYHQFVIKTPKRDSLKTHLEKRGIETRVMCPLPTHLQPAYKDRIPLDNDLLVNTERIFEEILSIPIYPNLLDEEIAYIIEAVQGFYA